MDLDCWLPALKISVIRRSCLRALDGARRAFVWQPTGHLRTRRQARAGSLRYNRVSRASSLRLLCLHVCARLGFWVAIPPKLGVNRSQLAGDSPGRFFVRSPSFLQLALLWPVLGQSARSNQSRCVSGGATCSLHACTCLAAGTPAPRARAQLTLPRREALCEVSSRSRCMLHCTIGMMLLDDVHLSRMAWPSSFYGPYFFH